MKTVLVVDHSMFRYNRVRQALAAAGYAVEEAETGRLGLTKFRGVCFDCVRGSSQARGG